MEKFTIKILHKAITCPPILYYLNIKLCNWPLKKIILCPHQSWGSNHRFECLLVHVIENPRSLQCTFAAWDRQTTARRAIHILCMFCRSASSRAWFPHLISVVKQASCMIWLWFGAIYWLRLEPQIIISINDIPICRWLGIPGWIALTILQWEGSSLPMISWYQP